MSDDEPLPPAEDLTGAEERGPVVVLLQPKRGANVGAVCRAIKNMGASGLVVIDGRYDPDEARRTAVHAGDVLGAARTAASLGEAVAGARLVVGTTSRHGPSRDGDRGGWHLPVEPIDRVLAEARARGLSGGEIVLVFGPEERGLSNQELARCHRLAFIPTHDEYASLNLAQAAVVCLYEWLRGSGARDESGHAAGNGAVGSLARSGATPEQAEAGAAGGASASDHAQSAALDELASVLAEIGFLHGDQGERVMATIRSMLVRSGLDDREVRILRGICRQIRWAASRPG